MKQAEDKQFDDIPTEADRMRTISSPKDVTPFEDAGAKSPAYRKARS